MNDLVTRKLSAALALVSTGGVALAQPSDAATLFRTARIIAPSYYSHILPLIVSKTGEVAGTALRPDGLTTIIFKYDGTFSDLGTVGAATGATVTGINSKGVIVGGVSGTTGKVAFEYDPVANTLVNLTKLTGDATVARAAGINEAGHIALELREPTNNVAGAALWDGKTETKVALSGAFAVIPAAINDNDEIAGTAVSADNPQTAHPFVWSVAKSADLGLPSGAVSGTAVDINDNTQVLVETAGADGSLASFVNTAGAWAQVAQSSSSVSSGVDSNGDVAGELSDTPPKPFVWTNGATVDLNSVTASTIGPVSHVTGFSDSGEVVGSAASDGGDVPVLVNLAVPITAIDNLPVTVSNVAKTLTITGAGFMAGSTVIWNNTTLTPISVTLNKIMVAVPPVFLSHTGAATLVVANPDGTSSLTQAIQVAPAPAPSLEALSLTSALAGAPALTVSITGAHFSSDAQVEWNGTALTTIYSSDTSLVASIPASSLADVGTAQVTVVNGDGQSSASLTFSIQKRPTSVHQFAPGYQLVSLPADYALADATTILDSSTLSLAAWLPDFNQYVVTPTPPATNFVPGRGYWVRFARPTDVVAVDGDPSAAPSTATIDLKAGWNLIGNPLNVSVPVSQLQVIDDSTGAATTFTEAVLAGLVSVTIYSFDSASGQFVTHTSDSIQPYLGYWLKADRDVSITFTAGG